MTCIKVTLVLLSTKGGGKVGALLDKCTDATLTKGGLEWQRGKLHQLKLCSDYFPIVGGMNSQTVRQKMCKYELTRLPLQRIRDWRKQAVGERHCIPS